jgi:hypothetical protein
MICPPVIAIPLFQKQEGYPNSISSSYGAPAPGSGPSAPGDSYGAPGPAPAAPSSSYGAPSGSGSY